jgi:hypothetical protein
MSFYDFNSTFFLSVGTLLITGSSVCLGFALKSKCSNVKVCCGALEIVRDIEAELEENVIEHQEIQRQIVGIEPQPRSPPRSRRTSYVHSPV